MIAPPSGTGYLGGDYPNVVSINGQPHQCTIDLYYGSEWCGTQETLADGSWRFSNLNTSSLFDLVVRGSPLLEDMISSRRTPFAMPVVVAGGPLINLGTLTTANTVSSSHSISGTAGPYTFSVISGTPPSTIAFNDDGAGNIIISSGVLTSGTYQFRLKVQSSVVSDYCLVDISLIVS